MRIFPSEPQVQLYKDGFEENDILQRAIVGNALSDLVERIEDPVVVALDGQWGTGKTYFLKRWVGAHGSQNNGKATTVYFDAFANDYLSDPLTALISALSDRLPEENKPALERIKSAAFRLGKPVARVLLAAASQGMSEALNGIGNAALDAASNEASNALETYWRQENGRRAAMEEFRSALQELVKSPEEDDCSSDTGSAGARLVFVVDELDRCRPDFSLEVLEVIKHFFSVPGVIFILGANLAALENSVKARYGGDINAPEYLRKFINVILTLPSEIGHRHDLKDAVSVYFEHHLDEMDIPQGIAGSLRDHLQLVSRNNRVSIRDAGKILSSVSLLSNGFMKLSSRQSAWIEVTISLLVSKIVKPEIYTKFLNATVSMDDLEVYFDATITRRTRKIDEKENADSDHYTRVLFGLWGYLLQDRIMANEVADFIEEFGDPFPELRMRRNMRSVPKSAHRKWLDLFTLTSE